MTYNEYTLRDTGITGSEGTKKFLLNGKDGESIDVQIDADGRVVPLTILDKVSDKYGVVSHTDEYGDKIIIHSILSCDNLLYIAGVEEDDWYDEWSEDESSPRKFFPIKSYTIDPLKKELSFERIGSLRDQEVEPVGSFAPVSRFGGWPVDSKGEKLAEWPYYEFNHDDYPLVFQAQYQLPDGRMMWVFANGIQALQTVHPMEEDPKWNGDHIYKEGMSGKELFERMAMLYGRDRWHYDNREFIGQKRPVSIIFDNWKWEDNGIAILIEGEKVPSWITMKEPLEEMLPFLTVSEKAVSFPAGIRHEPNWIQQEKRDAYEYRSFLFQIDDGVGCIDFEYGDMGSLYVYWNGKDAAVGSIQCY